MNLALVTETFPPEINGVAMTLRHVVEGLAGRGHCVQVLRPRQSAQDRALQSGPWTEELFPGFSLPGYPQLRVGFPAHRRLRQLWTAHRPDLVHIATEGPLGWSALRVAHALQLRISSSFHTNFHAYSRHYGARWATGPVLRYLRWFHNRTLITLSPTPTLNEELSREGFLGIRLLSRGVNTRVFNPDHRDPSLRHAWGAATTDRVYLHVSRLAPEKNYPLLLEAWNRIRARDPQARFVVVSDGPLRKRLQRSAPWAVFTGFLSREDLARHYASADIFLYPSLTETFGNVVTEGLASGLVVVAFDYAAPAQFIRSGANGFTVPFGDREAFLAMAERVASLPAGVLSPVRAAARETTATISWDSVIDGLERDLTSLLPASAVRVAVP